MFKFRLYTAGNTQNSSRALFNLNELCQLHLANRYEIEVVDVFRDPQSAMRDGIRMTPTLLKLSPAPPCRIVGSLSHTNRVLRTLGLVGSLE